MTIGDAISPIVIIGAGPAGSVAAIHLARAGLRVILIEQHRFPRDKVCGECLSDAAMNVLSRLDLSRAVKNAGAIELRDAIVHSPTSGPPLTLNLPESMWGISRRALDEILLDAARASGAEVCQPARCEGIARSARLTVRLRCLATNALSEQPADLVLVADGKAQPGADGVRPSSGYLGIKAHFENVEPAHRPHAIELFGVGGCYGGLAPVEGGQWNVSWRIHARRLRERGGNIEASFRDLVAAHAVLDRRLRGARRASNWLAAPLPLFAVRDRFELNVIPIGNAAAAIEPIGGEGMGLAMRSAELAANAVLAQLRDGLNVISASVVRSEFASLWRTRSMACGVAAAIVANPGIALPAVSFGRMFPSLGRAALGAMGKRSHH